MKENKVFSKQFILYTTLLSILLVIFSVFIHYQYQLNEKKDFINHKIDNEIKKSLNKKIYEVEGSLTTLSSFYQASEDFSTSTFGYTANDLIKHYPIIENIAYVSVVYEEEKDEYYKDMYNNGLFNFEIQTNKKREFYLPITNIAPDSYKYTKYYGYDILNTQEFNEFFLDLTLNANISYSNKKIYSKESNLLYLAQATYYGTDIPIEANRLEQVSGYFIISINLSHMKLLLENEFPSLSISLEENSINLGEKPLYNEKTKIKLPIKNSPIFYVSHPINLEDLNLSRIVLYTIVLILFIIIGIYVLYIYKKHLIYEKLSKEQINRSEKMASLGEMIGNISHQWRQPLSAISMSASAIQLKRELNILELEELDKHMKDIINKTDYLSNTINTFRDFIKEEKSLQSVYLEDRIHQAVSIVDMVLADNKIKIIDNIDYNHKIKFTMVVGELDQVIINILNNAKDILIDRKTKEPTIELNLIKNESSVILTIEDNAGGIPSEIIGKIFEPYFTTKHKTQGTGLGLHMSYKIITESLKGKLYAQNTNKGAKFFIELPLN